MPGRPHHSEKMRACVADLQAKGTEDSSAYAICTASLQKADEPIFEGAEGLRTLHVGGALGQVRMEQYDGREHMVVPVVALREGVIHAINAKTPEFVPESSLSVAPHSWDGRHVVLGHPVENGHQISANSPHVLETQAFGQIFNTRMDGKKLLMDVYIDPVKAEKIGGTELLQQLKDGKMCEVSVGAYVTTDDVAGDYLGKPYKARWQQIGPDHLAFLPKGRGACSIEMGCGAPRSASHLITAEAIEVQMREAAKGMMDCPTCEGSGSVDGNPCETCDGEGEVPMKNAAALPDKSEVMDCPTCDGSGKVGGKDCDACDGSGEVPMKAAESPLPCCILSALADKSYEERQQAVQTAIQKTFGSSSGLYPSNVWSQAIFDDHVIVRKDDKLYSVGYAVDQDGTVTFDPDPTEVKVAYIAAELKIAEGRRNSAADQSMVQTVHDHSVKLGADCSWSNANRMLEVIEPDDLKLLEADPELRDAFSQPTVPPNPDEKKGPPRKIGPPERITPELGGPTTPETGWPGYPGGPPAEKNPPTIFPGGKATVDFLGHAAHGQTGDIQKMSKGGIARLNVGGKTYFVHHSRLKAAEELRDLRTISQEERDKIPADDFAGPHRSFFIVEPGDVSNAASSLGRTSGDTTTVKAKIISIAYRKGDKFVAELPEAWKKKSDQTPEKPESQRAAEQPVVEKVAVQPPAELSQLNAAEDKPCGCKGDQPMTTDQRADTVKFLIGSKHSGFTAGDEKMLEAASDERLDSFRVAAEARGKEIDDLKTAAAKQMNEEEFMKAAPAELKSLIERQIKQETEMKTELVAVLKTAQDEYGEAELANMSIDALQRLARVAKLEGVQPTYEGRGLPRALAGNKPNDVYRNPPNPYDIALEKRRSAAGRSN